MQNLIIHSLKSMLLVIILTSVSMAQVKFGATLGAISANLTVDPDEGESFDAKIGFNLGAVLEYPVNDNLNIRSGAALTGKGAQFNIESGAKIESVTSLLYLTVPILAQYKFNTTSTTPYVLGGLDIGILMSAESKITISGTGLFDGTETVDVKDNLTSTDIALNIGGGYMMEMGTAKVYAEVQYSLGLLDIDSESDVTALKTKGLILGVGYIF